MNHVDVLIIGASASGLMCAIEAAKRGKRVVVIDQANKPGRKILMSGGGRCNFTNYHVSADNFISHNPHFCKSALSRYTQWDFIELVQRYDIPYHERDHGQLFCNDSARDILAMLLSECSKYRVEIKLKTQSHAIEQGDDDSFIIETEEERYTCRSLVVASGGLSIPSMGSSPFGYQLAEQFGIKVWPTSAGLVPFTLQPEDKARFAPLTGIAVDSEVTFQGKQFRENILFTHRGLSGPAILQISSYWLPGQSVTINLLPELDLLTELQRLQQEHPKQQLKTVLSNYLPKRLVATLLDSRIADTPLQQLSTQQLIDSADIFHRWQVKPNGTEGYRTAEVTLGGVDCDALSSKTMQAINVKGLYFVGEVVDVTGWLGGYNFQWAWSSGWCAGQYV